MSTIEIRNCGITEAGTDAVVNAANEDLREGGGVCGAIFRAAGSSKLTEACSAIGHCDTGSAVITPGFDLCRYIVHAVGPRWGSDHDTEKKQLYSCYSSALRLAKKNGCRSIAFPLISAGIFGVPAEVAWRKALQACLEYRGDIEIVFTVPEEEKRTMGRKMLKAMTETTAEPETGDMIIFHDPDKEYGFLSNWYLSDFSVDGVKYTSAEQYLMCRKAELFGDAESLDAIMLTDDPEKIQQLGRKVSPFAKKEWDGMRQLFLFEALLAKFKADEGLKAKLLATGNSILAEGTASDTAFANGLRRDDPSRFTMDAWPGQNLLGFALMEVRHLLAKETH